MKRILKFLFHRVVIVAIFLLIQIVILGAAIFFLQEQFAYFYGICIVLSLVVVVYIINDTSNPSYKIAWLIPIMTVPIFGGLFYLMFGRDHLSKKEREKFKKTEYDVKHAFNSKPCLLDEIKSENVAAYQQAYYINHYAYYPPCANTETEYLPLGEIKFERLKAELRKAKHFIFMEYFIFQEGVMWDSLLEILKEKVAEGVEVRVLYDDMGCITTLPFGYQFKLEKMGIRCAVFNPFVPVLSSRFNNRDHRKIVVIDGNVAFTGGINLADEYINAYPKHGHWKDTAIIMKGEGVWNFTVMFLSMWNHILNTQEDYNQYRPTEAYSAKGYIQPFTDSPLDGEPVGETVYMNMIAKAKEYVYIMTPYLILDNEMVTALGHAAKSGVDVRILTPHIPDKWFVHAVTRANYRVLLESGVKIYEYTPGFVHAKTFVVDGEYGVVGTINLDYRSLYLHFECGVWLYGTSSVKEMETDYLKTLEVSQEITLEEAKKVNFVKQLIRSILRIFAPLM